MTSWTPALWRAPSGRVAVWTFPHLQRTTLVELGSSCYIEAGKPARAAILYGDVLGARNLSRRDEGYFRARRAAALALSGEPEDAAYEGLVAMQLVTEMRSSRTRRELVRVVETLNPWINRPGPRALCEALTS